MIYQPVTSGEEDIQGSRYIGNDNILALSFNQPLLITVLYL